MPKKKRNWFAKRRIELDLRQDDIVNSLQKAGFTSTRSTISSWETGRRKPPLHDPQFRNALAEALELSVPQLLELAGYEIESQVKEEPTVMGVFNFKYTGPALSVRQRVGEGSIKAVLIITDPKTRQSAEFSVSDDDQIKTLQSKLLHGLPNPPSTLDITITPQVESKIPYKSRQEKKTDRH